MSVNILGIECQIGAGNLSLETVTHGSLITSYCKGIFNVPIECHSPNTGHGGGNVPVQNGLRIYTFRPTKGRSFRRGFIPGVKTQ